MNAPARPRRLRWLLLVPPLVAGLVLVTGAAAEGDLFPGADAKWSRYESPHVELYSKATEGESRELLYSLELVHAVFFEMFRYSVRRPIPLTVFLFSRDRHFEAYKPEAYRKVEDVSSFYHPELDRSVITMAPLPTFEAAQKVAFASYVYHLFRLIDERPPLWYSTGAAAVFRNLEATRAELALGQSDAQQVNRLRSGTLLPLETLLLANNQSEVYRSNRTNHVFHDQSWLLVHYLFFGVNQLPPEAVRKFTNFAVRSGAPKDPDAVRQAFEEAFGFDYAQMSRRLEGYARSGTYAWRRLKPPAIPQSDTYARRPVSVEEINWRLAEVTLRVHRSGLSKLALLRAADGAEAIRANEVLGTAAIKDGDEAVALERWQRAIDAGTTNAAVFHELGVREGRKWFRGFDPGFRLPDEVADRLRGLLRKSIAAAPEQSEAYEILAWVEATANAADIPNVNLVQERFLKLKDMDRTLLALALVRWRAGDNTTALKLLDALDNRPPSAIAARQAELLRARIENRPSREMGGAPVRRQVTPPIRIEPPKVSLPERR